jgi:hypothetical protein
MYYLRETAVVGEYTSKKEALADKENHEMWYPENNYIVVNDGNEKVN